jgi:molybdopterin/thiamine biosynthesis adenylyltransferase
MTKKIVVFGVGGVGSWIVRFLTKLDTELVRTGVKEIHVVDFDLVEKKNLLYADYGVDDIGLLKIDALARRYSTSAVKVVPHDAEIIEPGDIKSLGLGSKTQRIGVLTVDNLTTRDVISKSFDRFVDARVEENQYTILTSDIEGYEAFNQADDPARRGSCFTAPKVRLEATHMICASTATQIVLAMLRNEKHPKMINNSV